MRQMSIAWAVVALLVLLRAAAVGGDPKLAYTDPAEAGPDFAAQGEYVGMVGTGDDKTRVGVQIVALGDGKFDAVAYLGGLPGDGWDGLGVVRGVAERSGDVVVIRAHDGSGTGTIEGGVIVVKDDMGQVIGRLEKVERKSPTLGAKPPEGAVVLFDGSSADAFFGGRMTNDGLLVEGATSKQKFQDFTIHLEFRTPFQPYARGQARGNSGFYAQGRYEVQILDSFGLEGEWNECGGIYKVARPRVNMCFPPLSWQTYDVDFTAARFEGGKKVADARLTVRHNGVLIHQDVKVPETTTAAPVREESPEPGPIFLQNHGNPVRFRNVWVVQRK